MRIRALIARTPFDEASRFLIAAIRIPRPTGLPDGVPDVTLTWLCGRLGTLSHAARAIDRAIARKASESD
jgi:hypothetical protein